MDYSQHVSTKKTPQSLPIPGREMVKNSAGGHSFEVGSWEILNRFLILGTQGGSYYAKEREMTVENSSKIIELIKQAGEWVVMETLNVSVEGKAPKNDPAIFVLALACTYGDENTKKLAYSVIPDICRTGTHLFTFCQNIQNLRGWSRGLRNGVAKFYTNRAASKLAMQLFKYRQRNGWTHADVIRLAHPKMRKESVGLTMKTLGKSTNEPMPGNYQAFEEIQTIKTKDGISRAVRLISEYGLPWEVLPTELHDVPELWSQMIPHMGMTALLRNLSRFAKLGITNAAGLGDSSKIIASRFEDADEIKKSRLHPLTILNGWFAYEKGRSDKGHGSWTPSQRILESLEGAFEAAFGNVEPTRKNIMLALDVSGSMGMSQIAGTALNPREGSMAMALITQRTEENVFMSAFSQGFISMNVTRKTSIKQAIQAVSRMPFDGTDCAMPMLYALKNKIPVDAFVIYTDSETWAGQIHPTQALEKYRQTMGRDAKLITVGMVANDFTIADPKDSKQMDVVGFSLDTPQAISEFIKL